MSEAWEVVIPATSSKEVAEAILERVREDGWAAHITGHYKSKPISHT